MLLAANLEPSKSYKIKVPDIGHRATGFYVCPADLRPCSGSLVTMPSFLPLGLGMYIPWHYVLGVCNLPFEFTRGSQLRDCIGSQKRLGLIKTY